MILTCSILPMHITEKKLDMKICFDSAYENGVSAIFNICSIVVNEWNS